MNRCPSQTDDIPERLVKRSYRRALSCLAVGWLIVAAVIGFVLGPLYGALPLDEVILSEAMVIAVASGAIASISLLPVLLAPGGAPSQVQSETETVNPWVRICSGVLGGTVIRMVGTVALFLTCRYHMASTTEIIAGMTIGWYVLLTSIEVFVLVWAMPNQTETNQTETSVHFDTPTPAKV